MIYYTQEEKLKIKSLRESGLTHQEIFEKHFPTRSKDSILSVCKRNRFIMQPHVKFTKEERDTIESMASQGISFVEITKKFPNRGIDGIHGFAARNGFKNNFNQGSRKYTCNKEFWDVPNKVNSYWAGFTAADGHVHHEGETENTYCFIIKLQRKDKEHLNLFKNHSQWSGEVSDGSPVQRQTGVFYYSQIRIHQKEWRGGLEDSFSIFPRKTWNLPLPNIHGELLDCYLAGFLDGDGSYVVSKNTDKIIISATGATTNILEAVNEISNRFDQNKNRVRKIQKVDKYFKCAVAGDTAIKMAHYLMSLPCPHLRRKYDRIRDYLISHPKYNLSLPPYDEHLASLAI